MHTKGKQEHRSGESGHPQCGSEGTKKVSGLYIGLYRQLFTHQRIHTRLVSVDSLFEKSIDRDASFAFVINLNSKFWPRGRPLITPTWFTAAISPQI